MRIKVGSDVHDGSVKAGLAALEKSFESGRERKSIRIATGTDLWR
jgi:hypothetical protein